MNIDELINQWKKWCWKTEKKTTKNSAGKRREEKGRKKEKGRGTKYVKGSSEIQKYCFLHPKISPQTISTGKTVLAFSRNSTSLRAHLHLSDIRKHPASTNSKPYIFQ